MNIATGPVFFESVAALIVIPLLIVGVMTIGAFFIGKDNEKVEQRFDRIRADRETKKQAASTTHE